jgi:hypothetical protein
MMDWFCPSCSDERRLRSEYPPGPDAYCKGCGRPLDAQERLAAAASALVRALQGGTFPPPAAANTETVGVEEAAQILDTTARGIYALHARGKLPPPVGPGRRLLWRRTELVQCRSRASSGKEESRR